MSQGRNTLHTFFKAKENRFESSPRISPKLPSHAAGLNDLSVPNKAKLVQNFTPSPLLSASSRLNQMPRASKKSGTEKGKLTSGKRKGSEGLRKRKAEDVGRSTDEPAFKQPKLDAKIDGEDRRVRLLQGLGDGTAQEANMR